MLVGELFHPWKMIFDTRETLEREKDELMKIHNLFLFLCSQKKEGSGNKNSWVEGDDDEEEEE